MFLRWLHTFLVWRLKHIRDRNFLIYLGILIGIISGLAAVALKTSVHFIQKALKVWIETGEHSFIYIIYPLIGIVFTVVIARYILREEMGHGITQILYAISKKSGVILRMKMYSKMITSAITVGFGGSVGLEAPIVVTGSAIGSNLGQLVHLNYKKKTLLIGCGAAGAISAIFNSPIAGVVFAIEVILTDVTISMFIPLLISSVFGALTSQVLLGSEILFSFSLKDDFVLSDVPWFVGLGLVTGLISVYFTRVTYWVEGKIKHIHNDIVRGVLGGIALGVLVLLMNPLYGEGYNTIKALLNGQEAFPYAENMYSGIIGNQYFLIIFLTAMVAFKPVASALTIGAGGSGGIFAPTLFLGGLLGYLFALIVNTLGGGTILSPSNFTLVGMCGVMSGVLHAPLTAIFLIAEITSGYTLFVPLMLVSAISFSATSYFETHSLYEKHLAMTGDLIPRNKDKLVLSIINLQKIIEHDLMTISPDASLGQLVELVRKSKRNIFPVVNAHGQLVGIITLDDIRDIMFDQGAYNTLLVNELMHSPPAQISSHENMQSVMDKFEATGAWNLPVIDEDQYVGFISKSRIFNTYRNKLKREHLG